MFSRTKGKFREGPFCTKLNYFFYQKKKKLKIFFQTVFGQDSSLFTSSCVNNLTTAEIKPCIMILLMVTHRSLVWKDFWFVVHMWDSCQN